MTAAEFVVKWGKAELTEKQAAQQHFLDLCELLDHPKPAAADPTGDSFCFERGAAKHGGGDGWADVWKRGFFGWEYKGKHKDLDAAYDQLLLYREDLENPPLLVVCDLDRIIVRTNFTSTSTQTHEIKLQNLASPRSLEILRAVFHHPDKLKPGTTSQTVTTDAATRFADLANALRKRGLDPHQVAHFLDRIVFCLFAEDIGLLREGLFTDIVAKSRTEPSRFSKLVGQLFSAMAAGGDFGADTIRHFNGNLFSVGPVLDLTADEIERVFAATELDWSAIDPSILGTLFERGLDPGKRSQLGAHYTSREDIETVVEPVVMQPLRREWAEVKQTVENLLTTGKKSVNVGGASTPRPSAAVAPVGQASRLSKSERMDRQDARPTQLGPIQLKKARGQADAILHNFLTKLGHVTVLDPACGSGNFLYVTLQKLKDLEKEVILYAMDKVGGGFLPQVGPWQLYGIEINPYAYELAQMTVWIGYLQWTRANGFTITQTPILRPMEGNFFCKDAILSVEGEGASAKGSEPEWPKVDFIVSNPPFLGGKKLRDGLGDEYVNQMFAVWNDRVPAEADLCCYWFEKARAHIKDGKAKRAGLLATQAIRGGANREVLQRIKEGGDIFFAVGDRDWFLDGANVHISIVGFDDGEEKQRMLDGNPVSTINPNLSSAADTTQANPIPANLNVSFMGTTKGGAFDITESFALELLAKPNPHGLPNSDVVVPWVNGLDVTRRSRGMWIIDFGVGLPEASAAQYEAPFEYIREHVKPDRDKNNRESYRRLWWQQVEARPKMRAALAGLPRFLTTITVSKHRLFVWMTAPTQPDHQLFAFARSDDYFFGVLHSRVHEVWALKQGTRLETRPRYTPTTCFETFPLPEPTDAQREAIALAAKELDSLRQNWLNPPEWVKEEILEFPASVDGPWARYVECGGLTPPSLSGGSTPATARQAAPKQGAVEPAHSTIGLARYPRLVPKDADCAKKLARRTLTNLYNERPTWLDLAHKKLDAAVFAAYGWPVTLSDDELLAKLLALNLERAKG